jgi:hypothetical protein
MNGNESIFRQKFTKISGLSSIRRLPRLGKIRLGIKKISAKTGGEYPTETDYFVCPAEIRKVLGEQPKELNIMFPLNDPEALFPQSYKWFGSSAGLKCRGDGETALRLNEETKEMEERECPCELLEEGKCKQRASLLFMMPGIKIGGVYQIDLSSYHSIVDINSSLDYAMAMLGGRIAMVPFILRRVPKETHNEGKKQIHYTLTLELDLKIDEVNKIRDGQMLLRGQNKRYEIEEQKEDVNPAFDTKEKGAVIEPETKEETIEREKKEAESQEKAKAEYHQSKENESKLKKEHEQGKDKIKSYSESKTIYKKKKEEGEKIEAEINPKDVEEVFKLLNEIDIMNWNQGLYYARKANLKVGDSLVATIPQLKKLLTEDRDQINRIVDARGVKEGTAEKYFKKLNEEDDPDEALA